MVCIAICCFCAFSCSRKAFCWFFFARSSSFCAISTLLAYPFARASISASRTACALSTSFSASSALRSAAATYASMNSFTASTAYCTLVLMASFFSSVRFSPIRSYMSRFFLFLSNCLSMFFICSSITCCSTSVKTLPLRL